jgi:heterodisulfide reductase subunit C
MRIRINDRTVDREFIERVKEISGENIYQCTQCGTCSASCPMLAGMEMSPRKLVHLLQMGLREQVKGANTAWVCASCHTCMARCPRGLDLTKVMEAVRQLTLRQNQDHVDPRQLEPTVIGDAPQAAMVSAFRKLTA